MGAQTAIIATPVIPKGKAVRFQLLGDATRGRSGSGGWQVVDRPRRTASTEWLDTAPMTLQMDVMLDGFTSATPTSVESSCSLVEAWEVAANGRSQPPVLALSGPVPHGGKRWVVQTLSVGPAVRDASSGHRIQQAYTLSLLEYVPAAVVITGHSPAAAAQQRQATTSTSSASSRRYTVKKGDTLSSIAAKELGDYRRWPEIAKLNNLRDPNVIRVGQVLTLPKS